MCYKLPLLLFEMIPSVIAQEQYATTERVIKTLLLNEYNNVGQLIKNDNLIRYLKSNKS